MDRKNVALLLTAIFIVSVAAGYFVVAPLVFQPNEHVTTPENTTPPAENPPENNTPPITPKEISLVSIVPEGLIPIEGVDAYITAITAPESVYLNESFMIYVTIENHENDTVALQFIFNFTFPFELNATPMYYFSNNGTLAENTTASEYSAEIFGDTIMFFVPQTTTGHAVLVAPGKTVIAFEFSITLDVNMVKYTGIAILAPTA